MVVFDDAIRTASEADALAVAELWLRSRRAAEGVPAPAHSDDAVRSWFQDVVVPAGGLWVATRGTALTAMMVLEAEWIEQLYVAPEAWRQGHGSRLLRFAQSSRNELLLWTFAANAPARAFYERHSFQASGPVSSDNEERQPAVLYRWARSTCRRSQP